MLLQLQAEQISKYWDLIKLALQDAAPPTTKNSPETINYIFESLLVGNMQCWVFAKKVDELRYMPEGIAMTQVTVDKFTKTRNLLIYLVYSFTNKITDISWMDALRKVQEYARHKKCDNIIAYTKNEKLCNFVQRAGGDAEWRFVTISLEEKENAEET